jgi:hypothetical protein
MQNVLASFPASQEAGRTSTPHPPRFNAPTLALFEKIKSLSKQKGYCWAGNESLGEMLGGRSESQISRAIGKMIRAGLLRFEMKGKQRRLFPLVRTFPPDMLCERCKNAYLPPSKVRTKHSKNAYLPPIRMTQEGLTKTADMADAKPLPVTPEPPPVVNATAAVLIEKGVDVVMAQRLVVEFGQDECRRQIEYLPLRKANSPPRFLVSAIRGHWGAPPTRPTPAPPPPPRVYQTFRAPEGWPA